MSERERARAAMVGKLVRLGTGDLVTGICVDVDYEHNVHTDRTPRADLDSGLVITIRNQRGDSTWWLNAGGGPWEIYGEGTYRFGRWA